MGQSGLAGSRLKVKGLGFRVKGLGFRVWSQLGKRFGFTVDTKRPA